MFCRIKRTVIVSVVILLIWGFPIFVTAGTSMLPTLLNDDWVLGTRFFVPERGDVVVCLIQDSNGKLVRAVKRIIAIGGDEVLITEDSVLVNGTKLEETYTYDKINGDEFSTTIEAGQYFVLGDNRLASYDSRIVGSIDKEYVFAEIIYNLSEFHTVR